jgi:hypothetical protein
MTKQELLALNGELIDLLCRLRDEIDDKLAELEAVDEAEEETDDSDEDDSDAEDED